MPEDEKTLLQELLRQEEALQFNKFSSATALDLGLAIVHTAQRAGQAVMVDIRFGDLQLFQHAMEGTTPDKLTADYKDGVLKVHLPKTEEVKPKPIEVKVA